MFIAGDVTMVTTDTTVAHIMDEQDAIKIKSSNCWYPIRSSATLLTSNGHRIFIRHPLTREYLMESSPTDPASLPNSFTVMMEEGVASPVIGLWACNFVWDPGPSGAHVGCAPTR